MMLIKKGAGLRLPNSIKNGYAALLLLLFFALASHSHPLYGVNRAEPKTITYYLYVADFAESFIEIPTSAITFPSSTIDSSYLAGRAPIYDVNNRMVGTC